MQSQLFGDLTEDVLRRAGIARGMRVLDVGCGVGDVSLMAAKMVGPGGFVLGVDQSPDAIAVAERRTVEAGMCHWTHFAAASLDSLEPSIRFDAVIGRLILMYLPDPAATLGRLASFVIRGGIVAFHEMAMTPTRSVPDVAEYDLCRYRIIETFKRAGFETDMAGKLYSTFLKAGLPAPTMIAAGRVEGGPESPAYEYIATTLRSLLPVMERTGVAKASQVDIDHLADHLREAVIAANGCIILPPMIGAWARTA